MIYPFNGASNTNYHTGAAYASLGFEMLEVKSPSNSNTLFLLYVLVYTIQKENRKEENFVLPLPFSSH